MKSLRAAIAFSEGAIHPEHALVCESPDLERQVIYGGHAEDGIETVLSYVEGNPGTYVAALEEKLDVEEYDVTPAEDGFYLYERQELGEGGEAVLSAFSHETVVLVPPIEFRSDRTMRLTLVGHPADLQATIEALPEGMNATVLEIGAHPSASVGDLTDRQREALTAAWEAGYYDVPRGGGIEAVAEDLGCAVSTASELLRRAESRLVASALGKRR